MAKSDNHPIPKHHVILLVQANIQTVIVASQQCTYIYIYTFNMDPAVSSHILTLQRSLKQQPYHLQV